MTHRLILQQARRRARDALLLTVSTGFHVLFTPLSGFFSPFPHGTGALSVTHEYLALRGGPR